MYDIHVGDVFSNADGDKHVTVIELLPLENKVRYEFKESGARRTLDRQEFLERFPLAQ